LGEKRHGFYLLTSYQHQSGDVYVDAIVLPIQRADVAAIDHVHLQEVMVLCCLAFLGAAA
jgi:hypothetical protein